LVNSRIYFPGFSNRFGMERTFSRLLEGNLVVKAQTYHVKNKSFQRESFSSYLHFWWGVGTAREELLALLELGH
jgi:hypothetical protein